jgi:uncharacterized membrane protein YfcA
MTYVMVLGARWIAGTLSGIVGFGSSIMLMPVLVIAFGPREAVPIMAVAAVMANLSRVLAWLLAGHRLSGKTLRMAELQINILYINTVFCCRACFRFFNPISLRAH